MFKFAVVFAVAAVFCLGEAKYNDRCGLEQVLRAQGFPADEMADWVCLVGEESSRDTDKVNTNRNKSKDYGLFRINNKDCNVTCADLLTGDFTKAAKCVLKIYKRHRSRRGDLPDISNC